MPKSVNVTNYHMQYSDVTSQYWHPNSERFAGGDNLLTALESGWMIDKCVRRQHSYAGSRSVTFYEFFLVQADKQMVMPVIENPYISRFLVNEGIVTVEA